MTTTVSVILCGLLAIQILGAGPKPYVAKESTDSAMEFQLAARPGISGIVVKFDTQWSSPPFCKARDKSRPYASIYKLRTTTKLIRLNAFWWHAGDVIQIMCIGVE